jgi:hypothetical protein
MSSRHKRLMRWQATHLAQSLYWLENGRKHFEDLRSNHSSNTPSNQKPLSVPNPKPGILTIKVPGIDELGLVTHFLYLGRTDYERVKNSFTLEQKAAWRDYVSRAGESAIYGMRTRKRVRLVDNQIVKRYEYVYVEAFANVTEELEGCTLAFWAKAEVPRLDWLQEVWQRKLEAA